MIEEKWSSKDKSSESGEGWIATYLMRLILCPCLLIRCGFYQIWKVHAWLPSASYVAWGSHVGKRSLPFALDLPHQSCGATFGKQNALSMLYDLTRNVGSYDVFWSIVPICGSFPSRYSRSSCAWSPHPKRMIYLVWGTLVVGDDQMSTGCYFTCRTKVVLSVVESIF